MYRHAAAFSLMALAMGSICMAAENEGGGTAPVTSPLASTGPVVGYTNDGGVERYNPPGQEEALAALNITNLTGIKPTDGGAEVVRPEGLPEGYDSWEAYGKAQLGKTAEVAQDPLAPKVVAPDVQAKVDAIPADIKAHPVIGPLSEEFARTGDVQAANVKDAATKLNLPEAVVQAYVDNAKAVQAGTTSAAPAVDVSGYHEVTGGKEGWSKFMAWANSTLSKAEIAVFGKAVDAGPEVGLDKTRQLYAQYQKAGGTPPRDLSRLPSAGAAQEQGYPSMAQQIRDQSDARYATDPAFRAMVERKIGASHY